jgi:hypothetical protein
MPETLIHHTTLFSSHYDEFAVLVRVRPDGKVEVLTNATLKPAIVDPEHPLWVRLKMPYTPQAQPLRLEFTREE